MLDHVSITVSDIPAAYFYPELLAAYPECKAILTIRDEDTWFLSLQNHYARMVRKWRNNPEALADLIKTWLEEEEEARS